MGSVYSRRRQGGGDKVFVTAGWVSWLLFAVYGAWVLLAAFERDVAMRLVHEDGLLQWLQVVLLVGAAWYCGRLSLFYRRHGASRLVRWAFTLFFWATLLLVMEEISWGKRLFGLTTPEGLCRVNAQNDITLHNLVCFQRFRHWLLMLFGAVGLGVLVVRDRCKGRASHVQQLVPPLSLWLAFALVFASGMLVESAHCLEALHRNELTCYIGFWMGRFSEIGELAVATVALAYAAFQWRSRKAMPAFALATHADGSVCS